MDYEKIDRLVNCLSNEEAAFIAGKLLEKIAPVLERHQEGQKAQTLFKMARILRGQSEIFRDWQRGPAINTPKAQSGLMAPPVPNYTHKAVPAPTSGQKGCFKPQGW